MFKNKIRLDKESMLLNIGRIELWWRSGSWRRPDEWVFEAMYKTDCGCHILEIGFFGITYLGDTCYGKIK